MPIRVVFKARFQCRSWLRWKQKAEKLINNNNTTKEEMSSSVVEAQMSPAGVYFQSSNTRRHQHVRFNPPARTPGIFPFLIALVCHRRTIQWWQEVPKGRRRKCTRHTLTPEGRTMSLRRPKSSANQIRLKVTTSCLAALTFLSLSTAAAWMSSERGGSEVVCWQRFSSPLSFVVVSGLGF